MFSMPRSRDLESTTQSVESWNRELRRSMGACWSARPPSGLDPTVSFKLGSVGDVSMLGISVSSAISYTSTPASYSNEQRRVFYIHMGSTPNKMNMYGQELVQQPGECMLGDSSIDTTSTCWHPHSTLCAGFPAEILQTHLPNPDQFVGKHLDKNSTYYRIVPTLLTSLYRATVANPNEADSDRFAAGLVKVFAKWCSVSISDYMDDAHTSYEQIRRTISANISDPELSVASIAKKHYVTTRYLQLLFAQRNDWISNCIRRERLRGCILDLRDCKHAARSITDIAFSWGFNSASHFSATFKKEFGLTARDYRHCKSDQLPLDLKGRNAGLLVMASEQLSD